MLEFKDVAKRFGEAPVLQEITVSFERGRIAALIGANGAGKTTLLNIATGILKPDRGTVSIGGDGDRPRTPQECRRLGVVRTFQSPRVFGELSVLENIRFAWTEGLLEALGSSVRCLGRAFDTKWCKRRADAEQLLRELELEAKTEELCSQLSYGQQRLVELSLAFLSPGTVYLLDEPSAGLASKPRRAVAQHLANLRARGATIVVVDHDVEFVRSVADDIVYLDAGRVKAMGAAADVLEDPSLGGRLWGA